MLNQVKKFFEQKSVNSALSKNVNPTTSASIYRDLDGSFLKTVYFDAEDEIDANLTVNIIINKQNSIVNEAKLVVKEKSDYQDIPTTQKEFLDFIKWINNPNSRPFPTSRNDIFKYMLSNYYKKGIYGVIYTFSKDMTFKNIQIPSCIYLESSFLETKYRLSLKNRSYNFTYSGEYRNYAIETENEIMILQVGGHFSNDLQNYVSYFRHSLPYIQLQNYLVRAATSFQQRSCMPSSIITISYERSKDEVGSLDATQKKEFDDAVKQIESDIRRDSGSWNGGGSILAKSPNIKIDIKPLSIPLNSKENIDYQTFISENLFPLIDGGSSNAYKGESQYSNNASIAKEDMYDGAFRQFNAVVIDSMNRFMLNLVSVLNPNINPDNYYLTFDESSVRIYRERIKREVVMLAQNNLLKLNDGQKIISSLDEVYSFITPDNKYDIFNSELSGNATKPRVEVKSVKPTEEMVKNATRALEWKSEYKRGGELGFDFESVNYDNLEKMVVFFSKNEKKATGFWAGDEGFPSKQRIDWDLNGGDAGKKFAIQQLNELN